MIILLLTPNDFETVNTNFGIRSIWPQTISAPVNSDPNQLGPKSSWPQTNSDPNQLGPKPTRTQLKNMCDFQPFLSPSLSLSSYFFLFGFSFLVCLIGCKEESMPV